MVYMDTEITIEDNRGVVWARDGGEVAGRLDFTLQGQVMRIEHTLALKRGMGVGAALVEAAVQHAASHGLKVWPVCSYAYAWCERHPQWAHVLDEHMGEGVSCQL